MSHFVKNLRNMCKDSCLDSDCQHKEDQHIASVRLRLHKNIEDANMLLELKECLVASRSQSSRVVNRIRVIKDTRG